MPSLLIVDGEETFVTPLVASLRGKGVRASSATDGKDALQKIERLRPDAIIICVELPQMSGYSICARLKRDENLRNVPLIVTSADAKTQKEFEEHKKLRTRAEDYLKKPFSSDDLLAVLGKHLRGWENGPPPEAETNNTDVAPIVVQSSVLSRPERAERAEPPTEAAQTYAMTADLIEKVQEVRREFDSAKTGLINLAALEAQGQQPTAVSRAVVALKKELIAKEDENARLKAQIQQSEKELAALRKVGVDELVELESERDRAIEQSVQAEALVGQAKQRAQALEDRAVDIENASREALGAADIRLRDSLNRENEATAFAAKARVHAAGLEQRIAEDAEAAKTALARISRLEEELKTSDASHKETQSQAEGVRAELRLATDAAAAREASLRRELTNAVASSDELAAANTQRGATIERLNADLAASATRGKTLQEQLKTSEETLNEARRLRLERQKDVDRLKSELSAANKATESQSIQNTVIAKALAELNAKSDEQTKQLNSSIAEAKGLREQLASLAGKLKQEEKRNEAVESHAAAMKQKLAEQDQRHEETRSSIQQALEILHELSGVADGEPTLPSHKTKRKEAASY